LVETANEHEWEIVAAEVTPDHVHLFVRVRPTDSPAHVARLLKGRTSRVLRQELLWLRHRRVLWSTSYVAASVAYVSEASVKQYLEHQWDDDK
jgi:putative transposase